MDRIFLDHNATTFPSESVREHLLSFSSWGNPSSIHGSGRAAKAELLKTRRLFAQEFSCEPGEVVFTSGGSESNNMVIRGLVDRLKKSGQNKIISSEVEHPSVYKTLDEISNEHGFEILRAPVSIENGLDYDFIEENLKDESVGFLTIMCANNETGEIFDLHKISSLVKARRSKAPLFFHSDMVQTLGKKEANLKALGLDFASFSAHKFYALQGTGVLFQKKGRLLNLHISGGGQERGRRAGTENLLGISSLGAQLQNLCELKKKTSHVKELRDLFERELVKRIEGVSILAQKRERLHNTSLCLIDGVHGETLLMNLDLKGFEVSTGAACSSGNPKPSAVLLAMGMTAKEASRSLRVSLGWGTSEEEIHKFLDVLEAVVGKIRNL